MLTPEMRGLLKKQHMLHNAGYQSTCTCLCLDRVGQVLLGESSTLV